MKNYQNLPLRLRRLAIMAAIFEAAEKFDSMGNSDIDDMMCELLFKVHNKCEVNNIVLSQFFPEIRDTDITDPSLESYVPTR